MEHEHPHTAAAVYTCSMHPEVQQDKPGKCPKCSMQLVLKEQAGTPDTTPDSHEMTQEHDSTGGHDMAKMDMDGDMNEMPRQHSGHGGHDMAKMDMSGDMDEMTLDMRRPWLWTNFTVMGLGFWLISSPFTFGYAKTGMIVSDVISGGLLVLFALMALTPRRDPLAFNALDGNRFFHPCRAARCYKYRAGDLAACDGWVLVHIMSGHGADHAHHDPLYR